MRNRFGQKTEMVACQRCGRIREVIIIKGEPISTICSQCHIADITGKNSPMYHGGFTTKHGYNFVICPNHPRANTKGYVMKSIIVLEKKLGRPILEGYLPHHLNGNKADDRPTNLIELSKSAHSSLTNYETYQRKLHRLSPLRI